MFKNVVFKVSSVKHLVYNECDFLLWHIKSTGVYTTFVMLMNTWSVMLTVLVLNLHHRNECRPIPGWLRLLAFEGIARLLCMYTPHQVIVYQQRIQEQRRKQSTGGTNVGPADSGYSTAGSSDVEAYKNRGPRQSLYQVSNYT